MCDSGPITLSTWCRYCFINYLTKTGNIKRDVVSGAAGYQLLRCEACNYAAAAAVMQPHHIPTANKNMIDAWVQDV
ncbi:unnamed protein product [Toxocara canis]|uniref:RNHCP domain-containing protein n=1 Tax=Toxocara canis TaxID=6265 RepID=A0A183UVM7_TOXCA|nr:unnamed protein product [Toxocara canis]